MNPREYFDEIDAILECVEESVGKMGVVASGI